MPPSSSNISWVALAATALSPQSLAGNTTAPYPANMAVAGTYCFDSTNPGTIS